MNMSNENVTGAQALVKSLEHAGVDVMFGIPGGAILPAYDPILIAQSDTFLFVTNRVLVMPQLVMPKQLVELVSASLPLDLVQQT